MVFIVVAGIKPHLILGEILPDKMNTTLPHGHSHNRHQLGAEAGKFISDFEQ